MKKVATILCLFMALFFTQTANAVVATQTATDATSITAENNKKITASDVKKLSRKEIETKLGRKLSWKERVLLKMAKPTGSSGLGFLMGFFLGVIGVLIAYLAFKDEPATIKGSWWGFGVSLLLIIIIYAIIIAAAVGAA